MIEIPRTLWAINVYGRELHLCCQQLLLRKYFGSQLHIHVFANHEDPNIPGLFMENSRQHYPQNTGHHRGCLDGYNELRQLFDGQHSAQFGQGNLPDLSFFKAIVWAHADSIFTDYAIAGEIITRFVESTYAMHTVGELERSNSRYGGSAVPWVYNDFFVLKPWAYRSLFPLESPSLPEDSPLIKDGTLKPGDLHDPIEVVLGRAVTDHGLMRVTMMGDYDWYVHPHRFEFVNGQCLSCDNDLRAFAKLLRDRSPDDYAYLLQCHMPIDSLG